MVRHSAGSASRSRSLEYPSGPSLRSSPTAMLTRASQSLPGDTVRKPATPQLPWFIARVHAFGKKRTPAGSPSAPNGSLAGVADALETAEDDAVADVDGVALECAAAEGAVATGAVAGVRGLSAFARSSGTQLLTHAASTLTVRSTASTAGASFAALLSETCTGSASS